MSFVEHTVPIDSSNDFTYLTSSNINVKHAFTARFGKATGGFFTEDNCNVLSSILDIDLDDIVALKQVHGDDVHIVTEADKGQLFKTGLNVGDGLVSQTPSIALVVFVADCVPILLHDPQKSVIAALHAGWRGTAKKLTQIAVDLMGSRFGCSPKNINAAIGPSAGKCCYETDRNVPDAMYDALGVATNACIAQCGDKYLVDLKEANRLLLTVAGIENITVSDVCTICSDNYWSHRKHGRDRGSQAAIICNSQSTVLD